MNFSTTDFTVFAIYIVAMIGFGVYLAFKEKNDTAESYFLASRNPPLVGHRRLTHCLQYFC